MAKCPKLDLISAFWSDLNPGTTGRVYTTTTDGSCAHGIAGGTICCAASCGQCGGSGCQARPGGSAMCCSGRIRSSAVFCEDNGGVPPCVSRGQSFTVEWANVPYYSGGHTAAAGSGMSTAGSYAGQTLTFELTLHSDGNIKLQYQTVMPSPDEWAPVSIGVENKNGGEGMQIRYGAVPGPNTAFVISNTCGRSQTMASIGWCPSYNTASCDFTYADNFCQVNYGGQLISIEGQFDYDRVAALIPNAGTAATEKYLTGLHSDGQGHWEYTNGHPADITFLRAHSNDQLAGVQETNMVFYPGSHATGDGGLHDCCGSWIISGCVALDGHVHIPDEPVCSACLCSLCGPCLCCRAFCSKRPHAEPPRGVVFSFVCEFYGAPGDIGLGLAKQWDDAEDACQEAFGGHSH